jgi:hypothetical protein
MRLCTNQFVTCIAALGGEHLLLYILEKASAAVPDASHPPWKPSAASAATLPLPLRRHRSLMTAMNSLVGDIKAVRIVLSHDVCEFLLPVLSFRDCLS